MRELALKLRKRFVFNPPGTLPSLTNLSVPGNANCATRPEARVACRAERTTSRRERTSNPPHRMRRSGKSKPVSRDWWLCPGAMIATQLSYHHSDRMSAGRTVAIDTVARITRTKSDLAATVENVLLPSFIPRIDEGRGVGAALVPVAGMPRVGALPHLQLVHPPKEVVTGDWLTIRAIGYED